MLFDWAGGENLLAPALVVDLDTGRQLPNEILWVDTDLGLAEMVVAWQPGVDREHGFLRSRVVQGRFVVGRADTEIVRLHLCEVHRFQTEE